MEDAAKRLFARINRYLRPSHLRVISRDLFRVTDEVRPDRDHLRAAMEWLCRAQDATGCGGVSRRYHLGRGWGPPYPETTGYIIPTFLHYARSADDESYRDRAARMGRWELEEQLPSGGVGFSGEPVVFDTGQVIFGWTALYEETGRNKFLDAALRAAEWLARIQDGDGSWSRHTYMKAAHTYHTRVAWSLLEVHRLTGEERYRTAAERNIVWALAQAEENGWFRKMSFTPDEAPLTHTIAYTLRGLLESSAHLPRPERDRILARVKETLENIRMSYTSGRKPAVLLPARLNRGWNSEDNYSCLVGDAQIAILWLKLYKIDNAARFLQAAGRLIRGIKATQSLDSGDPGIQGGIAGSSPLRGGYFSYAYPNWAAKFFADTLLLRLELS